MRAAMTRPLRTSPKDIADDGDADSVVGGISELGGDAGLSDVVVTGANKDD